jgi:hypothetical protein
LEQAISYQRYAFEESPQTVSFRDHLSRSFFNYAEVLRQLERPFEAAQASLRRRELWPHDANQLYSVAKELTLAYRQMHNQSSRWPVSVSAPYVEEVAATMRQAQKAGWTHATIATRGGEKSRPLETIAIQSRNNGTSQPRDEDIVYETFRSDPRFSTIWTSGSEP